MGVPLPVLHQRPSALALERGLARGPSSPTTTEAGNVLLLMLCCENILQTRELVVQQEFNKKEGAE